MANVAFEIVTLVLVVVTLKPFGPVHTYVLVPGKLVADRVILLPSQTGELLLAKTTGMGITVATTEALGLTHPFPSVHAK